MGSIQQRGTADLATRGDLTAPTTRYTITFAVDLDTIEGEAPLENLRTIASAMLEGAAPWAAPAWLMLEQESEFRTRPNGNLPRVVLSAVHHPVADELAA